MLCAIWYHLYNLKNVKNAHEGPGTLLEVSLLHGCFSRFLNCTNDTKLHKAEKLGNLLAFQICHALNLVYKKNSNSVGIDGLFSSFCIILWFGLKVH